VGDTTAGHAGYLENLAEWLTRFLPCPIFSRMFLVTEADAAALRAIYEEDGELSAAIELRRRFPGITDNEKARACVRSIAGWKSLPAVPAKVVRLRPGRP
jgi:hypothetical protein